MSCCAAASKPIAGRTANRQKHESTNSTQPSGRISNPLAQFTSGVLDDITYAGTAANGDSLMMTSQFVFFMLSSRQQEIGTFSAVLDPSAVPEPASLALMSSGLLTLAAFRRRRKALEGTPAKG